MTKEKARISLIQSGIFGKEFVPVWEDTYEALETPIEERLREAVTDTIYVLVDQHQIDEAVAYELYNATAVTHAFVHYTGYVME